MIKEIDLVLGDEIANREYLLPTRIVLETKPEKIIRDAVPVYFSLQNKDMWANDAEQIIEKWRLKHVTWGTVPIDCLYCSAIGPGKMYHEKHDKSRVFCGMACYYNHYHPQQ